MGQRIPGEESPAQVGGMEKSPFGAPQWPPRLPRFLPVRATLPSSDLWADRPPSLRLALCVSLV